MNDREKELTILYADAVGSWAAEKAICRYVTEERDALKRSHDKLEQAYLAQGEECDRYKLALKQIATDPAVTMVRARGLARTALLCD